MSRSSAAVAAEAVAVGAGAGAVPASPAESLLKGFAGYLRDERGVAELTVAAYLPDVRRFLARRRDCDVGDLTAAEVSKAVLGEVASRSPASVRRYGCALRSFLRYCHLAGLVENDLSASALPVAGRRRSLLPKGIDDGQARALLRACDRRRAAGRRDYAVIVLMLRLGLRAGEVAALTLDDINWRAGLITVHGKRGCVDQLPLPADVGEALAGYLRRGRPRTAAREMFVRLIPPQIGMSRSAVSTIVRRACTRGGLTPFGAHRLRLTAACDMLRAGTPLIEIGQVLRHRSVASTAAYARVDAGRLRLVARPWPAETAS
jgi:integrase/recombinase XerD